MSKWKFSNRSVAHLTGVVAPLVAVAHRALELSPIDFVVTDGLRTVEEQKEFVRTGKSKTMNSEHLKGRALDVAPLVDLDGDGKKEVPWDAFTWKKPDGDPWDQVADAFKRAAAELGVPLEWGGDWTTFADAPHFQLPKGWDITGWQPLKAPKVAPVVEVKADEAAIEAAIVEAGKTAPRVTPADLDAEIADEDFHVFPGSSLTVCALTLKNGFTVTGESACADPANFDAEIGRTIARKNAREKIWPLLGFRLRDKLAG
ncbi:M15 family metallopeptidase [Salipiger pacificus]|nr:M15 family metallopeptidase [Alloyangia pacifica]